jgi:hypothetical protein
MPLRGTAGQFMRVSSTTSSLLPHDLVFKDLPV